MSGSLGKVDLHIHSYASNVTDYYAANTFAIPESYSDPIATYHELRRQGMDLVTLTDHNSIDGVLEMLAAGLPGVFVSAEMTTTFPEDGCNIHVTVANMTEAQFAEVNRLRGNVYEMIDYVDRQIEDERNAPAGNRLAYWMTHPLMSTQNRPYGREGSLTVDHIAQALNCSKRHLHKAFSEEDNTLAHYIQRQRIQACMRELAHPARAHRTITEIAFSWGFNNGAHFSRVFREHTGQSPSDFRESALRTSA